MLDVRLEWEGPGRCPECGRECPMHDQQERTWRDLDLCADQLYLHALVPRIDCPEHGVKTVVVPWATGRTEFTERFERLAIALLLEMSVAGVARRLAISWELRARATVSSYILETTPSGWLSPRLALFADM